MNKSVSLFIVLFVVLLGISGCSLQNNENSLSNVTPIVRAANPSPTWYVDARVIRHNQLPPYDYYGAKDPTIVYYNGKYHVFYTGANQSGGWQMLYTSATTIEGLATAPRIFMSKISESYFCAPEVFYFEPKGLWYLIYQDGTYGAAYATTTNIADPNSWSGPKSFGISGNMGWDYYVICDDTYCYMYNTPDDGSGNIYVRRTTLANFPTGWSTPSVAISGTFEATAVYKSLADGKYYLIVEDLKDNRYYELWTSSSAGGPWTQVAEKWAWYGNLVYNADKWTTSVSHGEIIRAGINQKLEINDINRVDFLIQGTTSLSGTYQQIPWDLGVIHNYSASSVTSSAVSSSRSSVVSSLSSSRSSSISSVSSSRSSAVSSAISSVASSVSSVQYTEITLPFTKDGAGDLYWKSNKFSTTQNDYSRYVNSWNVDILDINGTSYANKWVAEFQIPAASDGYWYIHYKGSYAWSHVEIK